MGKYLVACMVRKTKRSGNDAIIDLEVDAANSEEMELVVKEEVRRSGLIFVRIHKYLEPV